MTQKIEFTNEIGVELIQHVGTDLTIVNAARVSFNKHSDTMTDRDKGLIGFLMRERHLCYDSESDVLTASGWKKWPEISGSETFVTLNMVNDKIELQKASAVIHEPYVGEMVQIKTTSVDTMVTPNHRMVSSPRTGSPIHNFGLYKASEFFNRSYRLKMGGGEWDGEIHCPDIAELVGFITADGHVGKTSICFSLSRKNKIEWLMARTNVSINPHSTPGANTYRIIQASEDLKLWAKKTYTETRERCFPRELLEHADKETLRALLDGYLMGDGSIGPQGKITASTVSRQLVDDLQELALKTGTCAVENKPLELNRGNGYSSKNNLLYRICFYRERNSIPRIGWTPEDRKKEVKSVPYNGMIHCVTVPNGTLYVRRNGKPIWSGNSPLEHCHATVRVSAPIFVAREHMRHRTQAFSEMSARYVELAPLFYLPGPERPLIQVGKPGAYSFEAGSVSDYLNVKTCLTQAYEEAWTQYQLLLEAGVAKEVARMALPVSAYSSWYASANLRNWLAFLSLRATEQALYEIRQLAFQVEEHLAELYPITMAAWRDSGRGNL